MLVLTILFGVSWKPKALDSFHYYSHKSKRGVDFLLGLFRETPLLSKPMANMLEVHKYFLCTKKNIYIYRKPCCYKQQMVCLPISGLCFQFCMFPVIFLDSCSWLGMLSYIASSWLLLPFPLHCYHQMDLCSSKLYLIFLTTGCVWVQQPTDRGRIDRKSVV